MKKKLRGYLIGISIVILALTLIFTMLVFWRENEDQGMKEVKSIVALVARFDENEDPAQLEKYISEWKQNEDPVRITRIAEDGTVLYDNFADPSTMENHADRPEVQQAMADGEGQAVRHSVTLSGSTTCYYAKRLQDGTVLRGALTIAGIMEGFTGTLPYLILIAAAAVVLAILYSWYITDRFTAPIRQMAEHPFESDIPEDTYPELRPLLTTIRDQRRDVMSAAQQRQEFSSNVSHELKTPLTSISGYAELIETGIASKSDVTRFAKEIHENADRMLKLINDIIQISELDLGSAANTKEERLDLYEVARQCAEQMQPEASKYHVQLTVRGRESRLTADRSQMEELIQNLADNAIRYNKPNGSVTISVDHDELDAILTVSDTGIGIPAESQPHVFERFYRVDKSRSRATGGTGLGLAIVKHIVAARNGVITLRSRVDEGTTIEVRLPAYQT